MFRSFKLGRLFGIPIYLHTTFFLLPAWMLLTNLGSGLGTALFLLLWVAAVFGCVVLHELGHALMARVFGIGTADITLYPIGGVARLERMSEKPLQEIAIALAGPAVNLVIAALLAPAVLLGLVIGGTQGVPFFSLEAGPSLAVLQFLGLLCFANLVLLGFNLLPCFPMDGGRVLRAALALRMGQLRATEIAATVGLGMVFPIAALALYFQSPMPVILAVFVLFAGQRERMAVRQREAARASLQPELVAIPVEPASRAGEAPQPDAPFTGLAWDPRRGIWVRWHNGHPVAYWG